VVLCQAEFESCGLWKREGNVILTCEECFLQRKCKFFGVSPMELDNGETVTCVLEVESDKRVLVNIPTSFEVDTKTGNIKTVICQAVTFRKRWWNRLRK